MESEAPFFGVPPAREPIPVNKVPAIRGKRVILSTPEGFVYDMRASSEPYTDERGLRVIDVVSEEDWYRWMLTGEAPQVARWNTGHVWVE